MNPEPMIRKLIKSYISDMNINIPAIVTNVERLKDGFINVRPLVNAKNQLTKNTYEYPEIRDIRVVFPSTKTSAFTFPVNKGDTVQLTFQSVDIDRFINGTEVSHDPSLGSFGNLSNCVAYVGFETYQKSCFNPNNYKNDFDNQNLNIVHNKNTSNEVTFTLTKDGNIKFIGNNSKVIMEGVSEVDVGNALVKTDNDVAIKGISVYRNITTHDHAYTDDGRPMITAPPNIK